MSLIIDVLGWIAFLTLASGLLLFGLIWIAGIFIKEQPREFKRKDAGRL